jgi:hypothetical protein
MAGVSEVRNDVYEWDVRDVKRERALATELAKPHHTRGRLRNVPRQE